MLWLSLFLDLIDDVEPVEDHLASSGSKKSLSLVKLKLPDITGRAALAVRPDVVNAKYHVITNATYNRDPVPRSSNTSRILTLVRYYAVIIARCGKLCM